MADRENISPEYLSPTPILDSDHPAVQAFAQRITEDCGSQIEKATRLYRAVRDEIWYDPYAPFYRPEHYKASFVIERGRSFCIPKAALLCALGRCCGIPTRLGFATVKNHLATKQLLDYLGSDLFVFHGFTEFFLEGKWVKATPAFNKELCDRHRVPALEFNGHEDSLFQPYNAANQKYMEYIEYLGTYADVPIEEILTAWKKIYGTKRVQGWIETLEAQQGKSPSRFEEEDVWQV